MKSNDKYRNLYFSDNEICDKKYRNCIGGKHPENWDKRGEFQLYFLKLMGMKPNDKLLDIGCGPIRAGKYYIDYLDSSKYYGFDYNQNFITISQQLIDNSDLKVKKPIILYVDNFGIDLIVERFDFAIAFSVFNHCDSKQRSTFFEAFRNYLTINGKLYVTHAKWLVRKKFNNRYFKITNILKSPFDIDDKLDMVSWGWPDGDCNVFPIVEIQQT